MNASRTRGHAIVELALLLPLAAAIAGGNIVLLRLASVRGRALSAARLGAALASRADVPPGVARAEVDDYLRALEAGSGGAWSADWARVTDLPSANFYRLLRVTVRASLSNVPLRRLLGRAVEIRESVAVQEMIE